MIYLYRVACCQPLNTPPYRPETLYHRRIPRITHAKSSSRSNYPITILLTLPLPSNHHQASWIRTPMRRNT